MERTFFIATAAFFTCLIGFFTTDLYVVPFFCFMMISACIIAITIFFGVEQREKEERESARKGGSNE
jgi:hypothetical protein